MLTQGAIGNLVNRYRAVLKKCNLMNTFGSLAVASMLVMGGVSVAGATVNSATDSLSIDNESSYSHNAKIELDKTSWTGADKGVLKIFGSTATFNDIIDVKAEVTPDDTSTESVAGIRTNESVITFNKDVSAHIKNSRINDHSNSGDQRQAAGIAVTNDTSTNPQKFTFLRGPNKPQDDKEK